MGRKSKYCVFHSLEGSGNQCRNGEVCGELGIERACKRRIGGEEYQQLTNCAAFAAYGFATKEQKTELKNIQSLAKSVGIQSDFTLRKIFDIHKKYNWNWQSANDAIREQKVYKLYRPPQTAETREQSTHNPKPEELIQLFFPSELTEQQLQQQQHHTASSWNQHTTEWSENETTQHTQMTDLAKHCGQELNELRYYCSTWTQMELNLFQYTLECAVTSGSVYHFQKCMQLLHLGISESLWENRLTSINWLKQVAEQNDLAKIYSHIQELSQHLRRGNLHQGIVGTSSHDVSFH